MPYATRTRVRPLPRPARPRAPRRSASVVPAGTGMTVPQQLGAYASVPLIYISFDGPNVANPAWLDVTGWVDADKNIVITPGRTDGLSDANAATCNLTVDNSDGRWFTGNPSGAWNGLIRKGIWLRVDLLPLSGVVSRRFTGFVQALPTTRTGKYADAALSASDRFVQLTQAPKLQSMIVQDWFADLEGAPYITGYFPLHEPAGAAYASDTSGQAPAGAQALTVRSHGVSAGSGIIFAGTDAPGFDQLTTAVFNPSGTPLPAYLGGTTGALPNGSYLQGTIGLDQCTQITCWIKTTTALQPIWSWTDPTNNYACGIHLDAGGFLTIWQGPLSGSNFSYAGVYTNGPQIGTLVATVPLNDGVWHQIGMRIQTPATTGALNESYWGMVIDGVLVWYWFGPASPATGFCPAPNMSRFFLGAAEGWTGDVAASGLAFFTGAISDLVVHRFPPIVVHPDFHNPWLASSTGHAGESTGQRVARLAAYAGLPVPQQPFMQPGQVQTSYELTTGTSAAINIGSTAHQCGPQATAGANVLDVMRTAAHTELMPLFVDSSGRITLQASTLRQNAAAAVTVAMSELDPSTGFADDFQYTYNEVSVTPAGQGSVTVDLGGAASQALYGIYATSIDSASLNPAEAVSLGAAIIGASTAANAVARLAPLAVEAATLARVPGYGTAWYDAVLALTVSGVVAVTGWDAESPYGAGGSSTHVIEGWTETISPGNHLFAWSTSPPQGPTYQLDSPTLGLLDTPGITLAY